MRDPERLYQALRNADAAGDVEAARRLASYIREQQQAEPAEAPPSRFAGATGLAASESAAQATTFGFAEEAQGTLETVPYAARELLAGRFELDDVLDYRRERVESYREEGAELAEENPAASTAGTVIGVGAQLAAGGVNPVQVGRGLVSAARGLASTQAPRALLSALPTAAKGAAVGAGYGGVTALGESEADLTAGEFGEAATDVAAGAQTGALVGAAAGGLLGAGTRAQAARAQRAAGKAAAAETAAAEKARELAVIRGGLDGKQSTLGGPRRAKARALALAEEPLPGDPSKKLLDAAETMTPDQRLAFATQLRQEQGQILGAVRRELAETEAQVSAGQVREQIRGAFGELPREVQAKALEKLDDMIGAASKDGVIPAGELRKLIEDAEGLAKFNTPNLEAALGNARGRVFQAARGVFVGRERELISKSLPQREKEYLEALRKYSVFSDFELGSEVILRRSNAGQKTIRYPKSDKIEPGGVGRRLLRAGELGAEAASMLGVPLAGRTASALRMAQKLK